MGVQGATSNNTNPQDERVIFEIGMSPTSEIAEPNGE